MKIVLYKDNLSTGRGADHQVSVLAGGLVQRGYEVTLLTCVRCDAFSFSLDEAVKVRFVERDGVRDAVQGYDVCLAAGSNEMMDLTRNGRLPSPIKTVVLLLTSPKGLFKRKRFIRNWRIRRSLNRADAAVLLSAAYERDFRCAARQPATRVIGQWPDIAPPPETLASAERPKVLVYPAALNRLKNQELLIRAFALLAPRFPDWELHLYGVAKNDYGPQCEALVKALGLASSVRFCGFTDDLPKMYAQASVLAFPSLLEGFPLTMLEGGLYGLPTVATEALQGVHDMVRHGVTGLVTGATPAAFAEGLGQLLSDAALRCRMGAAARERVQDEFSSVHILDCWEALLKDVVAGRVQKGTGKR